ncbi:MAG: hypothetical protein M3P08_15075 [Thermoproteota archaeon]|nr:hypothetical protein [Thermoproteota archaeon]
MVNSHGSLQETNNFFASITRKQSSTLIFAGELMKPIFLGAISIMFGFLLVGAHDSYQQGYNQGIHDWNMFAQDLIHHFICPYNDTSAYCFGYDAALRFETSDQ